MCNVLATDSYKYGLEPLDVNWNNYKNFFVGWIGNDKLTNALKWFSLSSARVIKVAT